VCQLVGYFVNPWALFAQNKHPAGQLDQGQQITICDIMLDPQFFGKGDHATLPYLDLIGSSHLFSPEIQYF